MGRLALYKDSPHVDVTKIPDIDIITRGKPITDFAGPNSFDFIVASHVCEHVPDFIGWLAANLAVLKPKWEAGDCASRSALLL